MDIIREAMEAQFSIERAKLSVENAKSALELARTAVELARSEESTAKSGLDNVLVKGENLGLSRRVVKTLSEELSSSILSSGLIKVEETELTNVAVSGEAETTVKRRATRTRRQEADAEVLVTEVPEVPEVVEVEDEIAVTVFVPVEAIVETIEAEAEAEVISETLTPVEVEVEEVVVLPVHTPVVEVETATDTEVVEVEAPKPVEIPRKQPMFLRNLNPNVVKS
jgi:hypothetical protein